MSMRRDWKSTVLSLPVVLLAGALALAQAPQAPVNALTAPEIERTSSERLVAVTIISPRTNASLCGPLLCAGWPIAAPANEVMTDVPREIAQTIRE